ncbi:MAG: hypothetical protein CR988_05520 [Treponema sp.]|nr:MAG: hypothetical protein CR988_05520 [Treponema sp.]
MKLSITAIIAIIFIVALLLGILYSLITFSRRSEPPSKKYDKYGKPGDKGVCPVCTTILSANEKIVTTVYPGDDDQVCYIYGCPHCYPVAEEDRYRSCPVCKKKLGAESFLYARYFDRKDSSQHIHILGCAKCRHKKQ